MPYAPIKTPIDYQLGDGLIETNYQDANNKIILGAGIIQSDIILEIIGNDLYIKFNGSDQLKLTNYAAISSSNNPRNIEIEFNDGSTLNDISNIPVTIYGTNGADTLSSPLGVGFTNKTISGGAGIDKISAVGTIIGGAGNDKIVLTGSAGGSNIIYNLGDGFDTVEGFYNLNDKITFGVGIDPSEVSFQVIGANLFIKINGVNCMQLQGYISKNNSSEFPQVEFDNGTVWQSIEVNNTDKLIVNSQMTTATRISGDKVEYINNSNLNITVIGQDRAGQATDNIISLGNGNDQITDIYGYNEIYAGGGNDTINSVGIISGGTGDDRITLGGSGQIGSTLLFDLGDGNDLVLNSTSRDKILFGAGIDPTMVTLVASGKDLIIQLENGQGQITIASYFSSRGAIGWLDTIEFADGTIWTGLNQQSVYLYGSTANDTIHKAGNYNAVIDGGDGDDDIFGNAFYGNNTIYGGNGNDNITALAGDDNYLDGGAGNDTIDGRGTFHGGTGDDLLFASETNSADTFLFNLGDGQDTITSYDEDLATDKIVFGDDVTAAMISFQRDNDNLIVKVGNGGDQILLKNYYANEYYQTINRFEFDDGTVWTDIGSMVPLNALTTNRSVVFNESAQLENQLSNLINTMASFAPETSSASILPSNTYDPNSVILATNAV